eukprot:SM000029S10512  [mRNA]  locus=s29:491654:495193:- [translate_table: standard]
MAEAGVPQEATRAEDAVVQALMSPQRKRRARELDQLLRTRLKPPAGRLPTAPSADRPAAAGTGLGNDAGPRSPAEGAAASAAAANAAVAAKTTADISSRGLLGGERDAVPPILIYGGAETGKTSVVQEALALLGRPAAFVGCRSCHGSPRALFEAALDQLLGHERRSAGHYAAATRCERVADFVRLLPDAAARATARWERERAEPLEPLGRPPPAVYLIFDNAELLRSMDHSGGASLLPALLKLPELTGLPNLSIILISSVGWDGFWSGTGAQEPLAVHFPDYTDNDLCRILQARHPGSALYSAFLKATLQPFSRACRGVSELGEALEPLFAEYTRPVTEGRVLPDEGGRAKLYALVKRHIRPALSHAGKHQTSQHFRHQISHCFPVAAELPRHAPASGVCQWLTASPVLVQSRSQTAGAHSEQLAGRRKQAALEFELPMWSKFLLMAAYVASRNPATTDADFFGNHKGGLAKKKRRRRRSGGSAEDQQEFELQEARLRGPAAFPLRRLLAILRCMLDPDDEVCANGGSCMPLLPPGAPLPADALMQLATLASIDLVARSGGSAMDILSNSAKFRCTAPAELVHQVARSLGFPLKRYLLYG